MVASVLVSELRNRAFAERYGAGLSVLHTGTGTLQVFGLGGVAMVTAVSLAEDGRGSDDGTEAPGRDCPVVIWVRGSIIVAGASRFAAWLSLTTMARRSWR